MPDERIGETRRNTSTTSGTHQHINLRPELEQPLVERAAAAEVLAAVPLDALHMIASVGVDHRCLAEGAARQLLRVLEHGQTLAAARRRSPSRPRSAGAAAPPSA